MKCDELNAHKADVTIPVYGTIADAEVYLKEQVDALLVKKDAEIAELKAALERDFVAKKSAEKVLSDLLDCGLIKEWFYNGTFHTVLKADDPHLQIVELKAKLEDVQASAYAESVDAGMENRRLRRELWLARAMRAEAQWNRQLRDAGIAFAIGENRSWDSWNQKQKKWQGVERKCRAKAEEYK